MKPPSDIYLLDVYLLYKEVMPVCSAGLKVVELHDYSRKIYFPLNAITHQSSEMSTVENLTPLL